MGGIIDNLTNAINTWNEKMAEIWLFSLRHLRISREVIYGKSLSRFMVLTAIGLALLVLFFVVGMVRTCTNLTEIKRPEHALRLFLRFAIARGIVVYGMTIMTKVFEIVQGITAKIMSTVSAGSATTTTIPEEIIKLSKIVDFWKAYQYGQ